MTSQTGTIQLVAEFPNKGAILRPGGFGRIRFKVGTLKNAMLIPQAAVIEVQSMYQVVVVGPDNKASYRPIKVGDRVGTNWIVQEGLKPGEKVIVEGFMKVREGTPVTPSPTRRPRGGGKLTMSKFFINRPIVAIVISILMVLAGVVSMLSLPTAQFPNIADPQIQVAASYTGADANTVAQSVATPIEQQMSGVDGMNYMYSLNSSNGAMNLTVDFDVDTNVNTDQILSQMRVLQANSQLPASVLNQGVTVQQSTSAPLMLIDLSSPNGTYDNIFLANYATINLNDAITRVPGVASVSVFGAGQYAMRCWVNPDKLANLGITVPEIISAIQAQNNVNPAGQIGGEPVPPGQQFTYTVRAPGRLPSAEEFGEIIVRARPDGSILRLKDVARVELGAQNYSVIGRLNGKPAALIAVYQSPGGNAVADRSRRPQIDGREQGALSRRISTTSSPSTPRSPSMPESRKSSTRSSKRWSWSSSSSTSFFRARAPRSSLCSLFRFRWSEPLSSSPCSAFPSTLSRFSGSCSLSAWSSMMPSSSSRPSSTILNRE